MKQKDFLLIADTMTAIANDLDDKTLTLEMVAIGLADSFADFPEFDRVQFLSDCELAEGVSK